ncbi:MAG: hypothetical protein ACM30H_05760 [Clostridia bacterium]
MSALDQLSHDWSALWQAAPGRRFQELYRRRHRRRESELRRLLLMAFGGLLVLFGALLVFTPGPGAAVAAFGAVLIAGQSRRAALVLDRWEIRLRRLVQ